MCGTLDFSPTPGVISVTQRNKTVRLIDELHDIRADWCDPANVWDYTDLNRCAVGVAVRAGIAKGKYEMLYRSPLGMTEADSHSIFTRAGQAYGVGYEEIGASQIADMLVIWLAAQTVALRFPLLRRLVSCLLPASATV